MYLYIPLTADERDALRARKLKIRQGGDRPAYLLPGDCQASWPGHIPTLVFIPWVKP